MARKVFYQKIKQMEKRPGVEYATQYYIQSQTQRKDFQQYIYNCFKEISDSCDESAELYDELQQPVKGFRKTNGENRSAFEVMEDMANELKGTKRDGTPKDVARAPVDRWNKMFPQYAVEMTEDPSDRPNRFKDLFK